MADHEQGDIGHDLFRAACRMGIEGIAAIAAANAGTGSR
jgi:hypothetical protein